ncbi:MAG TPA: PEP/pyruvate-binding domain-containing protein [Longimicrobiales bacterium]|nr:PEP/pyruvate-binding domain-containing protein [Longimicrobiales bacterium]
MRAAGILDGSSPPELLAREGGGKAAQLASVERLGFAVPRWFCIPAGAMDLALECAPDAGAPDGPELPPAVEDALRSALTERGMSTAWVAVRSSGLEEDGAERSFAGQFESVLNCRGEAEVARAVRRCWASAFSERIAVYRNVLGNPGPAPRMGVVVQVMVDAESAGVAFSRNPLRAVDRDTVMVESVWGLGDALVSGDLAADRFAVSRLTWESTADVASKEFRRVRGRTGGSLDEPLDEPRRSHPSLTREQVTEVARMAVALEDALGLPQDCEWAYGGGRLFLLQARPITTLPPQALFDPETAGSRAVIWDNSNIIESYAGVTTPLTFSHVSRSYREVYRVTCRVAGVPEEVIARHEPMFRNMLGLIRGRVYYNLANWYRLLSLFPLLGRSDRFMETMMGVRQSLSGDLAEVVDPTADAPRYGPLRRLALLIKLVATLVAGGRERAAFLRRMTRVCGPMEAADLGSASLEELVRAHRTLEEEVLQHWSAPINNDTRCMVSFGLLGSLTRRWITADEGEAAALQNDLLCGQGDLTSAEPTRVLLEIARDIDDLGGPVRDRFLSGDPESVWRELEAAAPDLRARFLDYVRRFGFRCVDELKLESPDFHDRPHLLVATVRSYLVHGVPSEAEMRSRERAVREAAEARVRGSMRGPRLLVYRRVLEWTRRAVSDRERLRFERTRAFGLIRRIFRGVGRQLVRLGALREADDVFFLTVEEILAFAEGRAISLRLDQLAAARRAEYEEYRNTPDPPDRFLTIGAPGAWLRYPTLLAEQDLLAGEDDGAGDGVLRGTPCCAGIVEGTVRVARSYDDCAGISGEILVTRRTDPGWIPVFPALSGLIVERGGLLSHSAVVAREMGIPTIVGVGGNPLERLRSGDRVRMDGARGTVEVLS